MPRSNPAISESYISAQLLALSPTTVFPHDIYTLQIVGAHGKTNWLSITGSTLKKSEKALMEDAIEKDLERLKEKKSC